MCVCIYVSRGHVSLPWAFSFFILLFLLPRSLACHLTSQGRPALVRSSPGMSLHFCFQHLSLFELSTHMASCLSCGMRGWDGMWCPGSGPQTGIRGSSGGRSASSVLGCHGRLSLSSARWPSSSCPNSVHTHLGHFPVETGWSPWWWWMIMLLWAVAQDHGTVIGQLYSDDSTLNRKQEYFKVIIAVLLYCTILHILYAIVYRLLAASLQSVVTLTLLFCFSNETSLILKCSLM